MKLLLTSDGLRNESIKNALLDLLGKPFNECHAIYVHAAPNPPSRLMTRLRINAIEESWTKPDGLDWKRVDTLVLPQLFNLAANEWVPQLLAADVILVQEGDPLFLNKLMRESGFLYALSYFDGVYVGRSSSSMVLTPRIGNEFVGWHPSNHQNDQTLGIINFSIFPHLGEAKLPLNNLEGAKKWKSKLGVAGYAIDDHTALKILDDKVEVISEGDWMYFSL